MGTGFNKKQNLITCYADFIVAGAAIHGSIILGQEWYLGLSTALGTNNRVHFTWATFGATTHTARRATSGCAAGGATTGLVHQAFLLVKLLLTSGKYEIISAFTALQGFVNEIQTGTSLVICGIPPGRPYPTLSSCSCRLRIRRRCRMNRCQADVTSLSVTPSSAVPDVLEDHYMPDRDRIDTAKKHTLFIGSLQDFYH